MGCGITHVDAFVGKARRYGGRLLLGIGEKDGELFDSGHGDVTAIVSGQ
jgi:hypothetical protein